MEDIVREDCSYEVAARGVFSALIAGINSESQKQEFAREFLQFMLSEEEQKIFMDGMYAVIMGLPVNKDVFAEAPSGLAKEKLEDDVTNLTTPAMENTVVMDAIQNGADGYLAGEKSLEAAVEEIYKALELWMYEK